jgi:hypothetical protein
VAPFFRKLRGLFPRNGRSHVTRNIGESLLEWPLRAQAAGALIRELKLPGPRIADYGCGKQTLRSHLDSEATYFPFDFIPRSPDTKVLDFNHAHPPGSFDVGCCLGVLEYLDCPLRFLRAVIEANRFVVFSYNGPTDRSRRKREGWKNELTFDEIEAWIGKCRATIISRIELGKNERLYLVSDQMIT